MGSGVDHRVVVVIFREIRVIRFAVECELKNAHPRQMKLVAQVHTRQA